MKTVLSVTALAAGIAAALPAGALAADRAPSAAERAAIEAALKEAGYLSWEEVELDDDGPYWDVDDARKADKSRWDVKLAEGSYELISEEVED